MKKFIKDKIREAVSMPSFDLPQNTQPTPEDLQMLKNITWHDIILDVKKDDGVSTFYFDVKFKNPELNKFSDSIVFSIQQIKGTYFHPHLFLSDKLQGMGVAPKLMKAFIMDFGHIYVTKARTLNPNFTKMIQGLANDPELESYSDDKATVVMKKGNPDRDELLKIIRNNPSQAV